MTAKQELKENGNTVQGSSGAFVAADAIAKLSGLSLRQVRRMTAAIQALSISEDVSTAALTDFYDTPLGLPDEQRVKQTNYIVGCVRRDERAEVRQLLDSTRR